MASVKFVAVSRGLKGILDYVTNREKTTERLITGVNCVAQTALHEFEAVKKQFRKTEDEHTTTLCRRSLRKTN